MFRVAMRTNKRIITIIGCFSTAILATWLLISGAAFAGSYQPVLPTPLNYSTYLGQALAEAGQSIAIDAVGNAYVTGYTQSTKFPTSTLEMHGIDVFVAKFNPDGKSLAYSIWINALALNAQDYGYGIAVDSSGSAYVTGETYSSDFCTYFGVVPGYQPLYQGNGDAFVMKVKPDGSGLDYCTFIGGSDGDIGRAIAVDETGSAYITGGTWSVDFPTTPGAYSRQHNGLRDTFVVKLDPTGTLLSYATFAGGSAQEEGTALAVDAAHTAHVTGWTNSDNFTTTVGVPGPSYSGAFDGFVFKLSASSGQMLYATYLGGSDEDRGYGLALDGQGSAYLTGVTRSADFPATSEAFDPYYHSGDDAFVAKLNNSGSQIVYATYLGGISNDYGRSLAVDAQGRAYLSGETASLDFPLSDTAFSQDLNGISDAFIAQLDSSGSELVYSSFLGGNSQESANDLAVDENKHTYIAGQSNSSDYPVTPDAYDTTHNGDYDIFVTQLEAVDPPIPLAGLSLSGPDTIQAGTPASYTAAAQPLSATLPITYIWQISDLPWMTRTAGLSDTAVLSWENSGPKELRVKAFNQTGIQVEALFYVNVHDPLIPPPPLQAVEIGGPLSATLGDNVLFSAAVTPVSTTLPVTYTWQASEQAPVTHRSGLHDAAAFAWSSAGVKLITLSAANISSTVTSTHTITIFPPALEQVTISGPQSGTAGESLAFSAAILPLEASQPITYLWQASGLLPITHTNGLSDTASFAWQTAGPQTVTLSAWNNTYIVTDTHTLLISPQSYLLHLPAVFR